MKQRNQQGSHVVGFVLAVAVLGFIGFVGWRVYNSPASGGPGTSHFNEPKNLNRQFGTLNFAAGYVTFDPQKFKTTDIKQPNLETLVPATGNTSDKQVFFINEYQGTYTNRRLLMYDFEDKKTYVIAEDKSAGDYTNAKIMSNHYVVYASYSQSDPVTANTAIKVIDLNTGTVQTIMEDKANNLPSSSCCSVSPDGLRLVIPQDDKFLVYQAGDSKPKTYKADVKAFPQVDGNDNDDYAASQRNFGYPSIIWVDANQFVYAKAHPSKYIVDKNGTHAQINKNGLAVWNFETGKSTDVAHTSDYAIKWFDVDGSSIIFTGFKPNISGLVDSNSGITINRLDNYTSSDTKVTQLTSHEDFQSDIIYDKSQKQLYILPTGSIVIGYLKYSSRDIVKVDVSTGKVDTDSVKELTNIGSVEGLIGPGKFIVENSQGDGKQYSIYTLSTGKIEHLITVSSP